MGIENVYVVLLININSGKDLSSYDDIINLFNQKYPNNKIVITGKYLLSGSIIETDNVLDDFIRNYPSGKRATISTSTSILVECSNYFSRKGLNILNLSLTATSNLIKNIPNVLTYAYLNQYASINNFMIYNDYQMKYIHVLYQKNTTNEAFLNDYLNQTNIQANLLNVPVSVSFLEAGKSNYNIKENSMVIVLANTLDLTNIYITDSFIRNFPKKSFIICSDYNINITNIFGSIPAFVQILTNINFTPLSEEVYNAVKNNSTGFTFTVYPFYDTLFVLNNFTTNGLEITKENYTTINPYGSSSPSWILNTSLSATINSAPYGKYQYIFTKDIIIGDDIKLFLTYYNGGQQQLSESYSIFKITGITPNNPSLIEYDESEYYKIYDNNDNLLCVRNNCNITDFPAIYDLNIGTTLYTKFIYEYTNDGYFSSLKRLYPYNGTIPEVNSTMSKIPIKLKYNVPNKLPTYLSSKAYIDYLLSQSEFIIIAELLTNTDPNSLEYTELYNKMNDYLSGSDSKYIVDIVSSDGRYLYCSEFESTATVNLPNQNTCPEVLASVNFLWGNPMINKTAFPIQPIYPAYIAPTISEGYGISDRYSSIFLKNLQFICKTWGGNDGPMNGSIFSLRVSQ